MKHHRERISPCVECHRDTPPLGETVCRRCQEAHAEVDRLDDLQHRIWALPDTPDGALEVRQILEEMLDLIRGNR